MEVGGVGGSQVPSLLRDVKPSIITDHSVEKSSLSFSLGCGEEDRELCSAPFSSSQLISAPLAAQLHSAAVSLEDD